MYGTQDLQRGAVLISIPIATLFMIMQRCYNESMTGAVKG